jgi:hypothetical protein
MSAKSLKEVVNDRMSDSNPVPGPASSRLTLKLKPGARKAPVEVKAAPSSPPQNNSKLKSGAHWSDEHKQRMQADMDGLVSR